MAEATVLKAVQYQFESDVGHKINTMDRAERRFRGSNKYKKRIKLFLQIWGEYARTAHVLKSTSRPCSCNICKGNRYSRKQKHKQNGDIVELVSTLD